MSIPSSSVDVATMHGSCPSSYRGMSLTSQVCKVLEHIIKRHLVAHLERHNILKSFQHGFRDGRDCTTNLIETLNTVTQILDDDDEIDMAFLDFSKAFDKVNHKILLCKLAHCGISGQVHNWITGFLSDRTQCVRVNDSFSREVEVTSGVPQGSVLGPLLFLIYVNDLPAPQLHDSFIGLFADDTKAYCKVPKQEVSGSLQVLLSLLENWSVQNDLPFNVTKCKYIRFSRTPDYSLSKPVTLYGTTLMRTYEERDLGVHVTATLDPSRHIAIKVNTANFVLSQIRRAFHCRDPGVMLQLYKSLVRPHLDYGAQVWSPWKRKDIKKLESVQRRATRLIPACQGLSYDQCLSLLDLTTLEQRRTRGDMILTYKILTGKANVNLNNYFQLSNSTTRGHPLKLFKPRCRTTVRAKFFNIRCIDNWNNLPRGVISATTINGFKARYDKHMRITQEHTLADTFVLP